MKDFILDIKKYEYSEEFEVRIYERGCWQIEGKFEEKEDAINRANFLICEYDYKEDDIQIVKLTYYENITDIEPF